MALQPLPMYCRQCQYSLVGLPGNRCPECGTGFDPANPNTFWYAPNQRWSQCAQIIISLLKVCAGVAACGVCLLVLVSIPTWNQVHITSDVSITRSQVSSSGAITAAINMFRADLGRYPADLDELFELSHGDDANKWNGPYLKHPNDVKDAWGRRMRYEAPSLSGKCTYDLWSFGPDGLEGTQDDIWNE